MKPAIRYQSQLLVRHSYKPTSRLTSRLHFRPRLKPATQAVIVIQPSPQPT